MQGYFQETLANKRHGSILYVYIVCQLALHLSTSQLSEDRKSLLISCWINGGIHYRIFLGMVATSS